MKGAGFKSRRVNSEVYFHLVCDMILVAHVDDLLVGGRIEDLRGSAVC